MSRAVSPSRLRLVGGDEDSSTTGSKQRHTARQAVARENLAAAGNLTLDPTDPRWVFAVRAAGQLDGTLLTPERREKLMRVARLLGIRVFDANVIIAIVQDHARQGRPLADAAPTVAMMSQPAEGAAEQDRFIWLRWAVAVAVATVANALLIWWLLGGSASGG